MLDVLAPRAPAWLLELGSLERLIMMAHLDQLRQSENLARAWRWIRSNPDAAYKSHFRPLYQRYAVAEQALLDDLADRLKRDIYDPEPSGKLFQPKPSGILRPISLLSVEDQIVYQAAMNLKRQPIHRHDSGTPRRGRVGVCGCPYAAAAAFEDLRQLADRNHR